jgi:hypothetical protein
MATQFDATFIPCSTFGGGWITAQTDDGHDWLEAWFNDASTLLAPIGQEGWIVEPQDVAELAECARAASIRIGLAQ